LRDYEKRSGDAGNGELSRAASAAYQVLGEVAYEELLRLRAPRRLDFSADHPRARKRSEKRFLSFIAELQKRAAEASESFAKMKSPAATDAERKLERIVRMARVFHHAAELLSNVEIPRDVRTGPYAKDATAAFCDALDEQAEALRRQARTLAEGCTELERGATLSSAWSVECRALRGPAAPTR
jgi:hypothetical protein